MMEGLQMPLNAPTQCSGRTEEGGSVICDTITLESLVDNEVIGSVSHGLSVSLLIVALSQAGH